MNVNATPTSQLVKQFSEIKMSLTRKFLGNLFPKNGFEKNELKAYLKGNTRFGHKKDENGNQQYFTVRQKYFYQQLTK